LASGAPVTMNATFVTSIFSFISLPLSSLLMPRPEGPQLGTSGLMT
jgi:hypothetical protein